MKRIFSSLLMLGVLLSSIPVNASPPALKNPQTTPLKTKSGTKAKAKGRQRHALKTGHIDPLNFHISEEYFRDPEGLPAQLERRVTDALNREETSLDEMIESLQSSSDIAVKAAQKDSLRGIKPKEPRTTWRQRIQQCADQYIQCMKMYGWRYPDVAQDAFQDLVEYVTEKGLLDTPVSIWKFKVKFIDKQRDILRNRLFYRSLKKQLTNDPSAIPNLFSSIPKHLPYLSSEIERWLALFEGEDPYALEAMEYGAMAVTRTDSRRKTRQKQQSKTSNPKPERKLRRNLSRVTLEAKREIGQKAPDEKQLEKTIRSLSRAAEKASGGDENNPLYYSLTALCFALVVWLRRRA